jgi:hypothetical protein
MLQLSCTICAQLAAPQLAQLVQLQQSWLEQVVEIQQN